MTDSNTRLLIIGLTVATAVIHIVIGGALFILNGLGYLGLLGLMYLPLPALDSVRQYARPILIVYTIVTIIGYFVMNPDPFGSVLGLIDKAIELALVILLVRTR